MACKASAAGKQPVLALQRSKTRGTVLVPLVM